MTANSNKEIVFEKYNLRSADYHYKQINKYNLKKFNSFVYARYIKHINLILKHINSFPWSNAKTINILDVGCGDGVLLFLLQNKLTDYNIKIYGVDLSEEALAVAKLKIPNGEFFKTTVYDTRLEENFFDLIISSDVIEHVNYPEKMLNEIKRISRDNSLIIIGTPIRYTENPLDKMHVKEFFQQEYISLLSEYFNFIELVESHKQIHFLKYIKQTNILRININRYLYNILSFLGKNRFLEKIMSPKDFPTYMFAVCKN